MSSYSMTSPCGQCPFLRGDKLPLRPGRAREFEVLLERSEFPCHRTAGVDDDGEFVATRDSVHCAGALILLEKLERPSQMMRIAGRIGAYDASRLDMSADVFGSFDEMEEAARLRERRRQR